MADALSIGGILQFSVWEGDTLTFQVAANADSRFSIRATPQSKQLKFPVNPPLYSLGLARANLK